MTNKDFTEFRTNEPKQFIIVIIIPRFLVCLVEKRACRADGHETEVLRPYNKA